MPIAQISLGSNLGDRRSLLDGAVESLSASPGVALLAVSSQHETPPVGGPTGQGPFLNAALTVETSREPADLLRLLQSIEHDAGRVRTVRWGERTLDLDLLLYDDRRIEGADLTVPHPRLALRRFVLAPLAEIAEDAVDPVTGRTIAALLLNLDRRPSYVAIAGHPIPPWWTGSLSWPTISGYGPPPRSSRTIPPDPEALERRQLAATLGRRLDAWLPPNLSAPGTVIKSPRREDVLAIPEILASKHVLDDDALHDLLRVDRVAELGEFVDWMVTNYWFDFGARSIYAGWDGSAEDREEHDYVVDRRADVYAPTFVVATPADRDRVRFGRAAGDPRPRPVDRPDFPGRGIPLLIVDDYGSEATLNDVLAACDATRAG